MTSIDLDRETQKGLRALASLTGKSEPEVLRKAVAAYLEDLEDAREADRILDRIEAGEEGVVTLNELEQRLDLDG